MLEFDEWDGIRPYVEKHYRTITEKKEIERKIQFDLKVKENKEFAPL